MDHNPNYRHKNRLCKRNLKSIYFDREDNTIKQATACPSYPAVRKRRYVFVGQFSSMPNINNEKIMQVLKDNGIKVSLIKNTNLPF